MVKSDEYCALSLFSCTVFLGNDEVFLEQLITKMLEMYLFYVNWGLNIGHFVTFVSFLIVP